MTTLARRARTMRGVALITAMLIVALCTTAAVTMAARQQIDIRRTANVINGDQAYWFALGVESWAIQVLARDAADNNTDNLQEDWATLLPAIDVEGGKVAGKLEDLQGRFNLNSLVSGAKPDETQIARFQRLLQVLELPVEIAWAVTDWIDPDIEVNINGGAEDVEYLGQEISYRAGNGPMVSATELLLVKGVTPEVYRALAPFVTALPQPTPINVNTASVEVLMSIAPDLSRTSAQVVYDQVRNGTEKPFASVEDFLARLKQLGVPDDNAGAIDLQSLGVSSHYFLLAAQTAFGRGTCQLYSLIERDDQGKTWVVMHGQGIL